MVQIQINLSKPLALIYEIRIKVLLVLGYQGWTYIPILSKIANQMGRDHPFRNNTIQGAVGVGVRGDREGGGGGQNLKKEV